MAVWPPFTRAFVESRPVAGLATVGSDGFPHLVPICFVLIRDSVYSVVDAKPKRNPKRLRRLLNIATNPRATVTVDRYDEDWTKLEWAMLRGNAAIVEDDDEYDSTLEALTEKYLQYRAMTFRRSDNPMIRLDIDRVTAWAACPGGSMK